MAFGYKRLIVPSIVLGVATAGVIVLKMSHAGAPFVSTEPENGLVTAPANSVVDTAASGSKSIKFAAPGAGFTHPGVLVGMSQLEYIKNQIKTGQEPWKSLYSRLQTSKTSMGSQPGTAFTSLSYVPHSVATVDCPNGPASGMPTACLDEKNDAIAAYADILMYNYSSAANREDFAQKAVQILNDWSATLQTHTGANAPLQASWGATIMAKAAELTRYTYTPTAGKPTLNSAQMATMLNKAYLPAVNLVWGGGGANWLMSMTEATMNIAIFTDNKTVFDQAVQRWRQQVPSIIYMSTDTNPNYPNLSGKGYPIPPPGVSWVNSNVSTTTMDLYWHNPTGYVSGMEGESCRDPAHMGMGFGPMINIAETARLQGLDLYGEQKTRIIAGLEFNAGAINAMSVNAVPANWQCTASAALDEVNNASWKVTWEIAYNHYANRLGVPLPNTLHLITSYTRPSAYKADFGMDFEGLTHAGTP